MNKIIILLIFSWFISNSAIANDDPNYLCNIPPKQTNIAFINGIRTEEQDAKNYVDKQIKPIIKPTHDAIEINGESHPLHYELLQHLRRYVE